MESANQINCRNQLLNDIKKRNQAQIQPFENIIRSNNHLLAVNLSLKTANRELEEKNKQVEHDYQELLKVHGNGNMIAKQELDEERLKNKDEIIKLQQQLYQQSQSVINATNKLKEKVDELALVQEKLDQSEKQIEHLKNEIEDYKTKIAADKQLLQAWQEEKVSSTSNYTHIVEKYEKIKTDYDDLLASTLNAKANQTEHLNKLNEYEIENRELKEKIKQLSRRIPSSESNDDFVNIITEKVTFPRDESSQSLVDQQQSQKNDLEMKLRFGLKQAMNFVKDLGNNSSNENPDRKSSIVDDSLAGCIKMKLTHKRAFKFESPDGEILAAKYHKHGKFFATGGCDKKIQVWEYTEGNLNLASTLIGSNASVASIDIDENRDYVAGGSYDKTWRLWSLNASRMRMSNGNLQPTLTLTGHENKISSLKFLSDMKVVTGSLDRLIKLWDLNQKACIKTMLAGSSCHDLTTVGNQTIVSGHFNKRVYFWDVRLLGNAPQNQVVLEGKVTSTDVSTDKNYILATSREDNLLNLIDVRMFNIVNTYQSDDYRVAYDYSRALFSPDADSSYVCGCSGDGSVIIWNRETRKVEKKLKEDNSSLITMCWDPQGIRLIATDANKKAFIWNFY